MQQIPMETEILVVENEPADVSLLREMLADGRAMTVVNDLSTAVTTIEELDSNGALPELVLLDLRLPDGSGFDLLQVLRQELGLEALPVVVLTNSDSDADRERAQELGADRFETKPMDVAEFEGLITDIERSFCSTANG